MFPIEKILIIKFGALGDVLRTTPLLPALKRKYPGARISWLTDGASKEALEGNSLIDTLSIYSDTAIKHLGQERFDLSICLEKEPAALRAMMAIPASKKMGFGLDHSEKLVALDRNSAYAVRLGMDDDLKFRKNKKTYQDISFEQAGLSFQKEEYCFNLSPAERAYGRKILEKIDLDLFSGSPIVGLNTGSGERFAGKKLPVESYLRLSERLVQEGGCRVALLGGPAERERNEYIAKASSVKIYSAGCDHTIRQFAAVVCFCDLVITGDTLAMHIAIAMRRPVLVFFASTCANEIELYGRGEKLVSDIDCAPCYLRHCPIDEKCMRDFSTDLVFRRALSLLKRHESD